MDSEGRIQMVRNPSRVLLKASSVGSSLRSPGLKAGFTHPMNSPALSARNPESVAEVPPPKYDGVRKRPSDYELSAHRFQMI